MSTSPLEASISQPSLGPISEKTLVPLPGITSAVTVTLFRAQEPVAGALGLGGEALMVVPDALMFVYADGPVYGSSVLFMPAVTVNVSLSVSVRTWSISVKGEASRVPAGNDLACMCCTIVKPTGSVLAGAGLDALLTNLPTSIIDLAMSTLSGPAIAPDEVRSQPCEPAALAESANGPNPVAAFNESNFSLMFSPWRPEACPDADVKVCVKCPP